MQIINIQDWLDERGQPIPSLRRQVLRMARLIEYGGPLRIGYVRATLVECTRRVKERACDGLLWIGKLDDRTLEAYCLSCQREHILLSGWTGTQWADGPMKPIGPKEAARAAAAGQRDQHSAARPR